MKNKQHCHAEFIEALNENLIREGIKYSAIKWVVMVLRSVLRQAQDDNRQAQDDKH
jgi:hypothetical protein